MRFFGLFLFLVTIFFFNGCFNSNDKTQKFYGNVDVRTVSLAFRVSGKLTSIDFDEGEKVKKGQVIAKLDDAPYIEHLNQIEAQISMQKAKIAKLEKGFRKEEIKKAEAKLLQSQVERDRLKKEFIRTKNLYVKKALSEERYDNAKAAYDNSKAAYLFAKSSLEELQNGYEKEDILSAKANLEALQAQRNLHKINLEDTILISPTNGTIITRVYEVGSIVSPSQYVVEIAKDNEYWVRSYVSEGYLTDIKVGQIAEVYTDGGQIYKGKVSFISPIAEFTPKTVQTEELRTDLVYRFRIVLDSFDDAIKQGMPVTVTFPNIDFNK
ncbi:HlyD family efflux transporter periplasmic adaptor subunit [Sulfurimonas lithotrophica]|uniref:HlyD family efflux transporter periplasmic adaptor subunit n=1 Tax=Sulfurimonas lithotrophica TaxID=2590022 RepID=A0A5P8P113_9BACT|nr:efflux RND transporter periplasmic adaptor subunit [Sulfurimonas lithotrophica]QFR49405.1 HlyD family efflux transporter periplasmic adaptor subunit [Sulfurimonas lithotrophica]